jgi:pimeloyl-ACP methyl ester carboxylesterase
MTLLRDLALLATALGGLTAPIEPANAAETRVPYGRLPFEPCTLAAPGQPVTIAARCTTLRVPEDRSRPQGRHLELALAWIPSTSRNPAPDPVFMLAGGPGQSALESYPLVAGAFREVQRERHVILVDQRGTGRSHPLDCPTTLDKALGVTAQVPDAATARALARDCLAELRDSDPRFYTTSDYVADLEAVRGALGAEQVDLVGVSYGTRVGLEYLRRHPQRVRAAVLDSVVPPTLILGAEHARNLDAAVDTQFARCEQDAACRARYGSPRARLDALLAQLRKQPQPVSYHDPLTHELRHDTLTAEAVAGVVRLHAYAPPLFAMLPMLIEAAGQGRYDTLMTQARMVEQLVGEQIAVALQLSVSCAEDAPWLRPDPADAHTLLGTEFVEFTLAQCAVWPRGRVPADFHEPVKVDRPVLLLSGEFDPVTPPRYGERVAAELPRSRHLVLRGQGHGVMGISCAPRLLAAFLARPEPARLDAACLDSLGYTPPFAGAYGWDP